MIIDRNEYVEQLLTKCWNGKVKIVTGIRRSGKFLLSTLFKNRLIFFEKYWRLLSQDCCAGR